MYAASGTANIAITIHLQLIDEADFYTLLTFKNWLNAYDFTGFTFIKIEESPLRHKLTFCCTSQEKLPFSLPLLNDVIQAAATNILTPKKLTHHALS
jgi:hypothetical protein